MKMCPFTSFENQKLSFEAVPFLRAVIVLKYAGVDGDNGRNRSVIVKSIDQTRPYGIQVFVRSG